VPRQIRQIRQRVIFLMDTELRQVRLFVQSEAESRNFEEVSRVLRRAVIARILYKVDKKLFPRCLRLRGLDSDTLQLVFDTYSDQ
jgi:hypothetical protein